MKSFRQFALPALAVASFSFATFHIVRGHEQPDPLKPPIEPARAPFSSVIAGAGIVESRTENIAVGSHLPGVVDRVDVVVGAAVTRGQPLFRLDARQLEAELRVRKANLAAAKAQLSRLESLPRPEEIPAVEARLREAREAVIQQRDLFERGKSMFERRALAQEELIVRQQSYRMAQEQAAKAEADFKLLTAGAWEQDKQISRAAVAQAEALVAQTEVELDRLVVRAPVDGEALKVSVRPGEYVAAPSNQTLVLLGDVRRLHVRVDVDEHDIPRFKTSGKATASPRGDATQLIPLELVRVEPFVLPKKSLTGDSAERVDTRVLQVVYAAPESARNLHVGQQLDVFIDTGDAEPTAASQLARSP